MESLVQPNILFNFDRRIAIIYLSSEMEEENKQAMDGRCKRHNLGLQNVLQ